MNDVAPATNAGIATSDPRATEAGAQVLCNGGTCGRRRCCRGPCPLRRRAALLRSRGRRIPNSATSRIEHSGSSGRCRGHSHRVDTGKRSPPTASRESLSSEHVRSRSRGAPALLATAVERYGRKSLAELTAPAVALASEGFTVRPTLATACARAANRIAADDVLAAIFSSRRSADRPR